MAKLNVEIVTPERRLAQLQADEVIAPGADGLFGVRPGHTPYLSVMQPGPLTVREGTISTIYFVSGGFVEAGPTAVRVLADSAEVASAIDPPSGCRFHPRCPIAQAICTTDEPALRPLRDGRLAACHFAE